MQVMKEKARAWDFVAEDSSAPEDFHAICTAFFWNFFLRLSVINGLAGRPKLFFSFDARSKRKKWQKVYTRIPSKSSASFLFTFYNPWRCFKAAFLWFSPTNSFTFSLKCSRYFIISTIKLLPKQIFQIFSFAYKFLKLFFKLIYLTEMYTFLMGSNFIDK
jgi:hypothetical protein